MTDGKGFTHREAFYSMDLEYILYIHAIESTCLVTIRTEMNCEIGPTVLKVIIDVARSKASR